MALRNEEYAPPRSNASTATLSTYASLTNFVSGGGYTGAKAQTCSVSQTVASTTWKAANIIYTASGGAIGSVMYLVIAVTSGKLAAWSKLSTAAFTVTTGNTLTVTLTGGILKLV